MQYYAQLLKDGSIYKNNNIYIKYYKEEQFSIYKSTANILGCIDLKPEKKIINEQSKEDILIVQNEDNIFQFKIKPLSQKDKVFGYIYVGNNSFIKIIYKRKNILPFIFLFIGMISIIGGCFFLLNKDNNDKPIVNNPTQQEIPNLSEELTEIPLYTSFDLSQNNKKINLSNPINNTVDFKYEIYKENVLIYETSLISPGNQETINLYDLLGEGNYDLKFKIRCYLDGTEVNGTEEPVNINIK